MYPQVMQFETREQFIWNELRLLRERNARSSRRHRSRVRRGRFGLAFALNGQVGSSR